jgi:hypothetical protein
MDSKIINVPEYKTCKTKWLTFEDLILIIFFYPTAETKTVYKFTDEPTGRPGDRPPTSDRVGNSHQCTDRFPIQTYWLPRPPSCKQFGFDRTPDQKWMSWTASNSDYNSEVAIDCGLYAFVQSHT